MERERENLCGQHQKVIDCAQETNKHSITHKTHRIDIEKKSWGTNNWFSETNCTESTHMRLRIIANEMIGEEHRHFREIKGNVPYK